MEQRERIYELADQGLDEKEIEQILKIEFGLHAYCQKTIYKWMGRHKLGFKFDEKGEAPGPSIDEQLLSRIIEIINEEPFSSTRQIAKVLNENRSTVWRYLTVNLGLVYKRSRWLPHILDHKQKQNRMVLTKELSEILQKCEKQQWYNIMTGDSSWFEFSYGNDGAWLLPEEDAPEMDGSKLGVRKILVTVIWGIKGFYIIDFLPEGESFNTPYYIDNILNPLADQKVTIWPSSRTKRMWLHLDNCRVFNSKMSFQKYDEYGFKRPPQPAYSPDVAPSDFFLFGFAKNSLKGQKFTSLEDFKEKLIEIFNSISKATIKSVFSSWIKRCNWVASHQGAYYEKE